MSKQYYDFNFTPFEVTPSELEAFSLGEGKTPLTKANHISKLHGLSNVNIKHEESNPTGSFKDRESLVAITLAKRKGLSEVHIVSSGNAALSLAAYAKKAEMICHCYVPAHTTKEKKELITFFGGVLHEVEGNYEQVYRYVADTVDPQMNLTAGVCSERTEGNKTIAYELWSELGTPDVVIVPCGNGGNLAGIWKGFDELQASGKATKVPQMIAVQVAGAAPLQKSLSAKKPFVVWPNTVDSVAEGILAEESYCSPKAVEAMEKSDGAVVEVSEAEILDALKACVSLESLMIEPTSAAAFAALPKLADLGVRSDAKIVVVSTGSGMKMLGEIQECIK